MLEYHAAYYVIEDGWYMVRVLDFPGVITQGKNLEDARWMIRDALRLMAECTLERGEKLPRPNPRARDKKAERIECLRLNIRVSRQDSNETKKTAQGGRHTIAYHRQSNRRSSVPRHPEINANTAKAICEDLGIPVPNEK